MLEINKNILRYTSLILVLFYLQLKVWFSPEGAMDWWKLFHMVRKEAVDLALLRLRNQELKEEVSVIKQGADSILEEYARNELGLIKPGERFYECL